MLCIILAGRDGKCYGSRCLARPLYLCRVWYMQHHIGRTHPNTWRATWTQLYRNKQIQSRRKGISDNILVRCHIIELYERKCVVPKISNGQVQIDLLTGNRLHHFMGLSGPMLRYERCLFRMCRTWC